MTENENMEQGATFRALPVKRSNRGFLPLSDFSSTGRFITPKNSA